MNKKLGISLSDNLVDVYETRIKKLIMYRCEYITDVNILSGEKRVFGVAQIGPGTSGAAPLWHDECSFSFYSCAPSSRTSPCLPRRVLNLARDLCRNLM
jgi:hypothetical protein